MKLKQMYYTEQQIQKLKNEAEAKGMKISELVRRIIDEYFERRTSDVLRPKTKS